MGLGTLLEKIINVITLGYGKRIATWVANKLGKEDCGCNDRKNNLDDKVKLWQKKIQKGGWNL